MLRLIEVGKGALIVEGIHIFILNQNINIFALGVYIIRIDSPVWGEVTNDGGNQSKK